MKEMKRAVREMMKTKEPLILLVKSQKMMMTRRCQLYHRLYHQ
jgi:hypothetical protein